MPDETIQPGAPTDDSAPLTIRSLPPLRDTDDFWEEIVSMPPSLSRIAFERARSQMVVGSWGDSSTLGVSYGRSAQVRPNTRRKPKSKTQPLRVSVDEVEGVYMIKVMRGEEIVDNAQAYSKDECVERTKRMLSYLQREWENIPFNEADKKKNMAMRPRRPLLSPRIAQGNINRTSVRPDEDTVNEDGLVLDIEETPVLPRATTPPGATMVVSLGDAEFDSVPF